MDQKPLLRIAPILLCLAACVHSDVPRPEYINAPVNLSVSLIGASTYQLSFYSDNREGGFAGYGIFTGNSSAALNTKADDMPKDISTAQSFCAVTQQAEYKVTMKIQVGPAAGGVPSGASICDKTDLTLSSGSYVALRARVERTGTPWSAAAIAQVP
jgi:hypothetical protein